MTAIPVDIVSDVMCPWCYIGKRRFESGISNLNGVDLDIRWRPFQLDNTIPEGGMDRQEYLERKFGGADRAARVYQPIREAGAVEGIDFKFENIKKSPNTLNAHRVIKWALAEGRQDAVVERLFQLYFLEGADLTDHDVLSNAAADAGMDKAVVERLLSGDSDLEHTQQEIAAASQMGITGVPTFIVGNKYAVVGAQSGEVIASAIAKVMEEGVAPVPG